MKKFNLVLCSILLVLCIAFVAGFGIKNLKSAGKDSPEVRNNGTAIQWRYSGEDEWHDLVLLEELKTTLAQGGLTGDDGINGTNGKNGADGKDGVNGLNGLDGKDGADGKDGTDGQNGKSIEVRSSGNYIQWRYEDGEWMNLIAVADITGPSGNNGADGKDGISGKTPEFRVSDENTLQWRYSGDEIWFNLYELSLLKGEKGDKGDKGDTGETGPVGQNGLDGADGKDGIDGANGANGKDGNTPFIGENGNWWIGDTDTGIKAMGKDGTDGEKGDKGDKGDTGKKGDKGDKGDTGETGPIGETGPAGPAGQNGSCAGYFYGTLWAKGALYNENGEERPVRVNIYKEAEKGDLISNYTVGIYLKKGHSYSVSISGSIELQSNEDSSGNYSVQMTDNYDNDYCREATRIKSDGVKLPYSKDQHHFSFNRIYIASDKDIPLQFIIEQSSYKTMLHGFNGTIVITALD